LLEHAKAATNGHVVAQYNLAVMTRKGQGTPAILDVMRKRHEHTLARLSHPAMRLV
jgi:TPR repeat protein